ncbi:MAG: hypothetical protein A3E81_07175 [Gammaproteobacteria bacterium RIFCSPHIGHO2_12_FULL_36_30]|nr:MAG: hypothetical protein A3E81_07175 [Gammaproteobacteria bacterium RIFCSPHIGHO2_12_FULL_36_30]
MAVGKLEVIIRFIYAGNQKNSLGEHFHCVIHITRKTIQPSNTINARAEIFFPMSSDIPDFI